MGRPTPERPKQPRPSPPRELCHPSQRNFPGWFSANPPPRRPAGSGRPGRTTRPMPRHGGAHPNGARAGVQPAQSPARVLQRQPQRPPGGPAASAGRPSAPQRRAPARPVAPTAISAANSTARCPSGRGGPGPRAQPSREAASRAGGCGPSRATRASSRRRSAVTPARSTPHMSDRSGRAADSTTTSRSRIPSSSPSRHPTVPAARRTIRCRGCATAVLRTRTTGWSTACGLARQRVQRPGAATPRITTTDLRLVDA